MLLLLGYKSYQIERFTVHIVISPLMKLLSSFLIQECIKTLRPMVGEILKMLTHYCLILVCQSISCSAWWKARAETKSSGHRTHTNADKTIQLVIYGCRLICIIDPFGLFFVMVS